MQSSFPILKRIGILTENKVTFFWKSDETGVNTIEKRMETSVNQGCNLKIV